MWQEARGEADADIGLAVQLYQMESAVLLALPSYL